MAVAGAFSPTERQQGFIVFLSSLLENKRVISTGKGSFPVMKTASA